MVQTFDFMSKKNYKDVLIQKVTFSAKKELLTQPYERKPCINAQNLCVHQSNNVVFTVPISLSTQILFCVHTVSSIYNNPLLTGKIILSIHRLFCVDTGLCVSFCQEFSCWLRKLHSR